MPFVRHVIMAGGMIAALALTLSGNTDETDKAVPVSEPGIYQGYSTPRFDGYSQTTRHVSVRDGTRLAVTVYRPILNGETTDDRLPVLFSFTPYLARRIDESGHIIGTVERDRDNTRAFVDLTLYGYVVAVADVRGKGSSFGVRAAYADEHEGQDGHDLVEWLSAQPFSNGRVGMFGCSYVGGTQWATARHTPPSLKAIFPQAAQFDSYRNVRRGGISGQFNTRYQAIDEDFPTAPVDGDSDGRLKAQALQQHRLNGQMLDIVTHLPFRDDVAEDGVQYWSVSSPYPRIDAIRDAGIASYSWGNWMDEPADQSLISFENLRDGPGLAKLLMGPGGHCDTDTIDSFQEHLRFFDHVLKGIDNGIDREPPVVFKTIGLPESEAWRFTDQFPPIDIEPTRLHLDTSGQLHEELPAPGKDSYKVTYDVGCQPPDWSLPGFGSEKPMQVGEYSLPQPGYWACVNPDKAKIYTSAAMTEDSWLAGFSVLKLQLASSAPKAYVFGYLEELAPDGSSQVIAHGRLLSTHRTLGQSPYRNFGLPWSTALREDATPLQPGVPDTLMFELSPTSRIIKAGHRLRLSLTGADQRQRNLARIAEFPEPEWTITTGGETPSYLELHLAPVERLLTTTAPLPGRQSAATQPDPK